MRIGNVCSVDENENVLLELKKWGRMSETKEGRWNLFDGIVSFLDIIPKEIVMYLDVFCPRAKGNYNRWIMKSNEQNGRDELDNVKIGKCTHRCPIDSSTKCDELHLVERL
ncbi:hypothetical protein Tco_1556919 [Tanacetum coccineum]